MLNVAFIWMGNEKFIQMFMNDHMVAHNVQQ